MHQRENILENISDKDLSIYYIILNRTQDMIEQCQIAMEEL
jgi:hypothetical protein